MEGVWAVGNECEGEQGIFIPKSHITTRKWRSAAQSFPARPAASGVALQSQ